MNNCTSVNFIIQIKWKKHPETHNLPKLTQKRNNLNRPKTIQEIEPVIINNSAGPDGLTEFTKFNQTLKE